MAEIKENREKLTWPEIKQKLAQIFCGCTASVLIVAGCAALMTLALSEEERIIQFNTINFGDLDSLLKSEQSELSAAASDKRESGPAAKAADNLPETSENSEPTSIANKTIGPTPRTVTLGSAKSSVETEAEKETEKSQLQQTHLTPAKAKPSLKESSPSEIAKGGMELSEPALPRSHLAGLVSYDLDAILADYDNRMSQEFKIPPLLRDQVGFWFNIYAKWGANHRVIHHIKYPWIVFKVVDVTPIINAKIPKRRWQRNLKAEKHVSSELARINKALLALSKKSNYDDMNADESEVAEILNQLPGRLKHVSKEALGSVRVQTGQRDNYVEALSISTIYLKQMEGAFIKAGLPTELTRLPFVESSFNKSATSKAGASGIWQFVNKTGSKYMLVSNHIDERRSPLKATEAAAKLLKENYQILYRAWPLAITAYNHGPGGIRKAAKAVGTKDIAQIVKRYRSRSFQFASANYYTEFLAALYAEKYQREVFGTPGIDFSDSNSVPRSIKLPRAMRANSLAKLTGLSVEELLFHNPDLKIAVRKNTLVPKGFRLHLPIELRRKMEKLLARND